MASSQGGYNILGLANPGMLQNRGPWAAATAALTLPVLLLRVVLVYPGATKQKHGQIFCSLHAVCTHVSARKAICMFVCFLLHLQRSTVQEVVWGVKLCDVSMQPAGGWDIFVQRQTRCLGAHPKEVSRTCGSTLPSYAPAAAWGFVGRKGNAICSWSCSDDVFWVGQVWLGESLDEPGALGFHSLSSLCHLHGMTWGARRPFPAAIFGRHLLSQPLLAACPEVGRPERGGGLTLPPPS